MWKNGITVLKVTITTKVSNVGECLSGYFLNHRALCYLFWYGDAASWARVLWTVFLLWLSSRSRSQQGLLQSKYDSFYYIIWTVDSLATKLGLMIHHQKPECPMKKITAFRAEVTAKGQNLMFVQMISSKPSNILFSRLVLWFISMSQSVMQRDLFAIFKVNVTAKAHKIKIRQILLYLLNCWSFCYQPWFDST